MKNSRLLRVAFSIALGALLLQGAAARADTLKLGELPYDKCTDISIQDDLAEANQRYWFARIPPYVGYSKGEKTTAGGDGTCYLGFPSANKKSALIDVEGTVTEVFPAKAPDKKTARFLSVDRSIVVEVVVTGSDSTCEPNADKCCGDYTYATITVKKNGATKSVKAANYRGG